MTYCRCCSPCGLSLCPFPPLCLPSDFSVLFCSGSLSWWAGGLSPIILSFRFCTLPKDSGCAVGGVSFQVGRSPLKSCCAVTWPAASLTMRSPCATDVLELLLSNSSDKHLTHHQKHLLFPWVLSRGTTSSAWLWCVETGAHRQRERGCLIF